MGARPTVTFLAAGHRYPAAAIKFYMCADNLSEVALERPEVELGFVGLWRIVTGAFLRRL